VNAYGELVARLSFRRFHTSSRSIVCAECLPVFCRLAVMVP
jgi:hypothetical protein